MKKLSCLMIIVFALSLCACGKNADSENVAAESEQTYPKIVYIENETYYGTDAICENVPRKMPDGTIATYVDKEIMPDSYNSANFGSEQEPVEYMFLEDGQLIVHIGADWYYFEKRAE